MLAMQYFIKSHIINQYHKINLGVTDISFLPVKNSDPKYLALPSACFANEKASLLGFHILRR